MTEVGVPAGVEASNGSALGKGREAVRQAVQQLQDPFSAGAQLNDSYQSPSSTPEASEPPSVGCSSVGSGSGRSAAAAALLGSIHTHSRPCRRQGAEGRKMRRWASQKEAGLGQPQANEEPPEVTACTLPYSRETSQPSPSCFSAPLPAALERDRRRRRHARWSRPPPPAALNPPAARGCTAHLLQTPTRDSCAR